jgi:tetratricopeptide (TPR) repeat protein
LALAIDDGPSNTEKDRAVRAMAMSYAFERNGEGAAKYAGPLYERNLASGAFFDAGEVANELARVCLESNSVDQAATWYKRGYDAGLKELDLKAERRDLWEFRWEHAQARLAARRGQAAEARKHVPAAKAVLDKGTNPEQAQFFPYLAGYGAFYTGDFVTAAAELQKANQSDPFITCLLAQVYEKQGDKAKADELYRKVLTSNGHSPTNAYARPFAKQKLGIK